MSSRARAKSRSPPLSHHDVGLTIMFAGKGFDSQEWFTPLRPQAACDTPQLDQATGVAAVARHVIDASGS